MSRLFLTDSAARFFLINNSYDIFQKVTGSPKLDEIVSQDDYFKKLTSKLEQESAMTQGREIWSNVLYCLRDEGIWRYNGVDKEILKERLMEFNWRFEEACLRQARLLFPGSQLRDEYLMDIAEKLMLVYNAFVGRFRRHLEKYIKYSRNDLVMLVLNVYTAVGQG
ncbi:exocyst subunit exo70 family protein D1 [Thalictrum thalictroides]|uniref:Exocyst subunit Exo70 family protein n=1 Tax=Thalictrum thalictroides TaxID=46969 RepID=A0A7J6VIS5_THATH|nr:exocyst subunit exo70 family protein D1 [Thalictrum thalictroides]